MIITQYVLIATVQACESFSRGLDIMPYFCWIPASLSFLGGHGGLSSDTILAISYFNVVIYALIALATTRPVWKHIREVEYTATSEQ